MNKKIVYLIRHGEIDNPRNILYGSNIEMRLADTGRTQMRNLAKKILKSGNVPSKIYSSPLQRTIESSNILGDVWEISDIQLEEDLKDSYIPALAGKPSSVLTEIRRKGEDEYSEEFVKNGNESRENLAERMFGVYKKSILEKRGCIAIVSHGNPILFLLYRIENPDSSKIPNVEKVKKTIPYLHKGYAWKLFLDEKTNLLSKEIVTPL